MQIQLGPKAFSFASFQQWVDKAQGWFATRIPPESRGRYLAIDAVGRVCLIGRDFMRARDEGAFPVVVFLVDPVAGEPVPPGECTAPDCDCEPGWCRQRVPATFQRAAAPALNLSAVKGEIPGRGYPDWPEDLGTFAERKAYQRGIAHARAIAAQPASPVLADERLDNIEDMLAGYKAVVDGCPVQDIERFDYLPSIEEALEDFRALRSLLAAGAAPPEHPEGFRLLPVEATDAMMDAEWDVSMSDAHSSGGVAAAAWRAMVEAAPQVTYANGHSGPAQLSRRSDAEAALIAREWDAAWSAARAALQSAGAPQAPSGVDALWVERAKKLANALSVARYALGSFTASRQAYDDQDDEEARLSSAAARARDELDCHLSTALTGAAKE